MKRSPDVTLLGRYVAPWLGFGDVVVDAVRGEVVIVGVTDARIRWPIGKRGRAKSLVVFQGLEQAVRRE